MNTCHFCILRQAKSFIDKLGHLPFSRRRIKVFSNAPNTHFSLQTTNDTRHSSKSSPSVPRTVEEEQQRLYAEPEHRSNPKQLKIAIIGPPNSGKSTLINNLIKWRVCSVSSKVHTTVRNSSAVFTEDNTQLVFLDTPGIVTNDEIKKYKLKKHLATGPEESLQVADLIAILHDVSNRWTSQELHPIALRLLALHPHVPSILILNKVDLLNNRKPFLLTVIPKLTCGVVGRSQVPLKKVDPKKTPSQLMQKYLDEDKRKHRLIHSPGSDRNAGAELFESENATPSQEEDEPLLSVTDSITERKEEDLSSLLGSQNMEGISDEDVYEGRIKLTEVQVHEFIKNKIGWPKFEDVFMISALKGSGVEDLRRYFIANALPSPWNYSSDVVTDQSPQDIAMQIVREACMDLLPKNIPYELKYTIDHWEVTDSEVINLLVTIHAPNVNSYFMIVKKGFKIRQIATKAEDNMRNAFRNSVHLKINVACKKTQRKTTMALNSRKRDRRTN